MFDFGAAVGYEYLRAVLAPIWGVFRGVRETALQAERGAVRGYDCDAGKRTYAAEGGISP